MGCYLFSFFFFLTNVMILALENEFSDIIYINLEEGKIFSQEYLALNL